MTLRKALWDSRPVDCSWTGGNWLAGMGSIPGALKPKVELARLTELGRFFGLNSAQETTLAGGRAATWVGSGNSHRALEMAGPQIYAVHSNSSP